MGSGRIALGQRGIQMEQRISLITLGVSDLKKARAFYDALGWKVATENQAEEVVAYNLHCAALALFPWDKLAEDASVSVDRSGCSAVALAYNVNSESEVEAVLREAETAGGKIVKPAQKAFWGGYSGYFSDVDGHLWEVAFNPFFKLGVNGEFQWGGVR